MPLRSSGCFTCRKRKIRCDESRPHCKRCATHGVSCPGYRTDEPGGIEFRDQTRNTVKRARDYYQAKENSLVRKGAVVQDSTFGLPVPELSSAVAWIGEEMLSGISSNGLGSASTLPIDLMSPVVMRNQLYGNFMDVYLPKRTTQLDHFSFFQTLAGMPTEQPALLQGLDALSLVAVGSVHKDRALLNQAVQAYGRALSSLTKALSRPETAGGDEVLAAATVLATCALYDEIGKQDNSWGKHVIGTQQLIAARGPKTLNSKLALLLFSNTRHGALVWALIDRKAPYMALPEWRALAFKAPIRDSATMFYDAAIRIPGLLERYDKLGGETPLSSENVAELLRDCEQIEGCLRDWYLDWEIRAAFEGGGLYTERPIDEFHVFTSLVFDRTFETAFMFTNFPISYLASIYWMCMVYVRGTIQSLHTLRHELDKTWYPEPDKGVPENELMTYAVNLCKCIPFFCEPMSSCTGHIGIFLPMRTAAVYFVTHAHWREAKWVGAVRTSVFTKGLSPPSIGNRPDMLKGMEKLALWRHENMHPFISPRDEPSPGGWSGAYSTPGLYSNGTPRC